MFAYFQCAGFRALIKFLEPGYTMPSAKTIRKQISSLHEDALTQLEQRLENQTVSITTDHWTSISNTAYITVTVHFINEEWDCCSAVLETSPMPENHTGSNIAKRLNEIMNQHKIPTDRVISVVKDNARNMNAAMRELIEAHDWKSSAVNCFGHTLQLVVNHALDTEALKGCMAQARKLVGHFRHSALATHHLMQASKPGADESDSSDGDSDTDDDVDVSASKGMKLLQDVKTRWNSTFDMCSRLISQRWNIAKVSECIILCTLYYVTHLLCYTLYYVTHFIMLHIILCYTFYYVTHFMLQILLCYTFIMLHIILCYAFYYVLLHLIQGTC